MIGLFCQILYFVITHITHANRGEDMLYVPNQATFHSKIDDVVRKGPARQLLSVNTGARSRFSKEETVIIQLTS